jgi:hypothetical protein
VTRAFGVGSGAGVGVSIEVDAAGLAEIAGGCEVEGSVAEGTSLIGGAVSTPPAEHATNRRATAGARLTSLETMTGDECYEGALRHGPPSPFAPTSSNALGAALTHRATLGI